jgi:hypothetical protein
MRYGFSFSKGLAFALLASFSMVVHSQKNMVPGVAVTFKGDTLKGRIDYGQIGTNPDRISLTDDTGRSMILTPMDIERFSILGEVFVSAVVTTENSSSANVSMLDIPDYSLQVDTVFLRALAEGEKSLYSLTTKSGNSNFFIKNSEGYTLLLYKKYFINTGSGKIVAEEKEYVNQLLDYFSDNASLKNLIAATGYNRESLERLFGQYYSARNTGARSAGKPSAIRVNAGIFAGATLSAVILHSDFYRYLDEADYGLPGDLTGGVAVEIVSNRNFRRWSFNNEIQWSSWDVSGDNVISPDNGSIVYSYVYDLSFTYLGINSMLRFNHPAGKAVIFINAGMSNRFAVTYKNHMQFELNESSGVETGEGEYVAGMRKYEQALLAGGGIKYGKIRLEYRYLAGNGISISHDIYSSSRIHSLWLGYCF